MKSEMRSPRPALSRMIGSPRAMASSHRWTWPNPVIRAQVNISLRLRAENIAARAVPQLEFVSINETTGRLFFRNTTGPFGIGYEVTLGSINRKRLTATFRVSDLQPLKELKYSFWAGASVYS